MVGGVGVDARPYLDSSVAQCLVGVDSLIDPLADLGLLLAVGGGSLGLAVGVGLLACVLAGSGLGAGVGLGVAGRAGLGGERVLGLEPGHIIATVVHLDRVLGGVDAVA